MLKTFQNFHDEMVFQFPGCEILDEFERDDGLFYAALKINKRPRLFNFSRGYIITVSSNAESEWCSIKTRKSTHAGYGYIRFVYETC